MTKQEQDAQIRLAASSISTALEASGIFLGRELSDFERRRIGELAFEAAESVLCANAWFRESDLRSKESHLRSAVELVPDIRLAG